MGYLTTYRLSIHEEGKEFVWREDVESEIYDRLKYNPFDESCKWYTHGDEMKIISKNYPDTVILLECEGEDTGDICRKYFKNGKMQVCKGEIVFEDYNPLRLK